jgi:hypothetical protein
VCARFSSIYTLKKKEKFLLNFRWKSTCF